MLRQYNIYYFNAIKIIKIISVLYIHWNHRWYGHWCYIKKTEIEYVINMQLYLKPVNCMEFCLLLWLTWESLLQFFTRLITSFSYLHSWWMKIVHCTLPWCLWHESFYGTHTNVPDHVVPWCGSMSCPQRQSPEAFLLFCKSQPLLPVGQGQNIQCLPFPLLSERTPPCHRNSRK